MEKRWRESNLFLKSKWIVCALARCIAAYLIGNGYLSRAESAEFSHVNFLAPFANIHLSKMKKKNKKNTHIMKTFHKSNNVFKRNRLRKAVNQCIESNRSCFFKWKRMIFALNGNEYSADE